MAGKPYPAIYDICLRRPPRAGPAADPAPVLCIGDGLPTDVRGANAQPRRPVRRQRHPRRGDIGPQA
jgi:ribonucleotide monophosphatase NagD (HAD superfamily)